VGGCVLVLISSRPSAPRSHSQLMQSRARRPVAQARGRQAAPRRPGPGARRRPARQSPSRAPPPRASLSPLGLPCFSRQAVDPQRTQICEHASLGTLLALSRTTKALRRLLLSRSRLTEELWDIVREKEGWPVNVDKEMSIVRYAYLLDGSECEVRSSFSVLSGAFDATWR